jgi:hypothetical protein
MLYMVCGGSTHTVPTLISILGNCDVLRVLPLETQRITKTPRRVKPGYGFTRFG